MKKTLLLILALLAFTAGVRATDVTIAANQIAGFNPANIGTDATLTNVSVTNGSTAVTCSACLRSPWVGLGGFRISIAGTAYTVASVNSASSLTLTSAYAGATSSAASVIWHKYIELRIYANQAFQPLGAAYVVQPGTAGSGAWYRRYAASVVNSGATNTLYLPQVILDATTDAPVNNTAKYTAGFYRASDGSLITYYQCFREFGLPPITPTSWPDICTYNQSLVIVQDNTAYTKAQIDARFRPCLADQLYYFATTGNSPSCLTLGTGLSITSGVLNASGGGGGGGTVNNGTQYQIGYYAATGNTISSLSNWTTNAQGNFTLAPTLSSSGSPYLFTVNGPSHVGLLADTEATDINFNLNRTVQFNAGGGAFTNQRAVRLQAPTYSALSAETITNAISLDINSPSAGTNMTLSNSYVLRLAPTANTHHGLFVDALAGSTGDLARFSVGGINIVRINARNGDINSVFGDSALATNATDGFIYSPSMAGIPSGTPTSYSGTVPLVVDTADSRLYGYIGSAWVNLSGSGGGGSGTVNSGTQYQIGYYSATGTAISGLSNWTTNAQGNFTLAPTLSSSGSPTLFTVTGPAHVSLAADTEATDININLARTVQFTAGGGTFGTQRAIRMQAPTYSALSAETITNAITLDVASPTAGTNMTLTNSYAVRVAPSANAHNGLFVDAPAGSTGELLRLTVGGVNIARFVAKSGDLNSVFSDSALATSATDGFIYSPSMAGIPTGTPTNYTGTVPLVIDTTNYRLYGFSGIWRNLSRNTDYINVEAEYGAICDGATSAQTPIQNAINAAQSGTRKTVYIPGDCVVAGLSVTGQVNIIGNGEGQSILRSTTNAPIIEMTGDANFLGGSVQNLRIVGSTSAGTNQIGLKLDHATGALRFLVRDVRIETTGGNGLYVGNVFSSYFENIRISDSADYPLLYNAPNQPTNTFSNIYVGRLRATAPTGFRIKAGDFTGINLNGIDNILSNSNWMVVGKKAGVDGDVANGPATVVLRDSNIESWTSRGILLYSSSSVELHGATTFAGDGGTAASSKMGIQFELNGDGSTFFAQNIKRSKIDDGVNFADGVSAYNNSQPIQAPGFAPIEVTGVGPQTGGGANLNTYRDTSTPTNRKLARSDGRYSRNVITSSTSITQPGGSYYEVDSSGGAVTLTLEWPGWQANSQTMVVVKDVGGAAATNNITIQANSGGTVNGSSYVLSKNGEAVVLMPDGNTGAGDWRVVARHLAVIGDVSKVGAAAVEDYFPYWNASGQLTSQGPIYRLSNSLVVLESLLNNSNNSFDIGSLSSNRFRTAYFGTSVDVGINSSVTGSLVLRNSTNANSTTIRPGAPSSALTFTLPTTLPASAGCLQVDNAGAISQTGSACGSGGSGLGDPGANGIVVRTAVNITTARTITGTTNRISVTNGDGVSANPTLDIGTDVVTLTGSQTLTNKTLTSPVISTIVNTGTLTLPSSTDTLVGRATTDTLTNKTLSTGTSVSASISWGDGVTQTFNPNGTSAGVNVGGQAGDPSALNNGDVWYNSTTNKFRCRENGASVDCIGSGGGGVSGSGTTNSIPKWSGATALTDSGITDTGTTITVLPVAASSGANRIFAIRNPGASGLTASTEATAIQIGGDGSMATTTMSHATGALTLQRDIRIIPVTHAFAAASTLTTAITLDAASPIAGTNATLTNSVVARLLPSAAAHHGLWIENTSGSATGDLLRLSVSGVNIVRFLPSNGDINSVFSDGALGTTATDGFIYSPSMAGVPTGTPTSYTGTVPLVVDTTNSRLYGYIGSGWANLTGSGGGSVSIGSTITGSTQGSILFAGASSVLAQDNAKLFWDDTNNRLGIGTTSPQAAFDVGGLISAGALPTGIQTLAAGFSLSSNTRSAVVFRNTSNGTDAEFRFVVADDANDSILFFSVPSTTNTLNAYGIARNQLMQITGNAITTPRDVVLGSAQNKAVFIGTNNTARWAAQAGGNWAGTTSLQIGWSNSSTDPRTGFDTGFARHAAGQIRVTDGTTGTGRLFIASSAGSIDAQAHVISSAAGTKALRVDSAASPSVQTLSVTNNGTEVLGVLSSQTYGAAEVDKGNVSGSVTVDFNAGNHQKMRLTGNITTLTLSNIKPGATYILIFIQDGTGSRTTVTPTTIKNAGGAITLTSTANARDELWCRSDGTNLYCGLFFDVK